MAVFTKDKSFYRTLIALAIPISLQNLVTFAVNFADNLMIGSLGDNAISGVYVGGQLQSVLQMFVGGIEGAILILAAQYWGKKDTQSIRKVVSIGIKFALAVGLLSSLVAVLFPQWVIRAFTTEPGVIQEGAAYVQIVGFTYLFFSVSQVMIAAMRSVETARIGLYISCMALVINVCLNYVFIFGHFGFPAMGVRGAAIATVISQMISFLLSLLYHKSGKGVARWMGWKRADTQIMREVVSLGLAPAVFQGLSFVNNMITNHSLMLYADAELGRGGGDLAISAVSVIQSVENLAIMFVMGMNNAISTIISYNYGLKSFHRVKQAALIGQAIAFGVSFLIWAAMMFAPEFLFRIFSGSDMELISYGASAMRKGKMLVMFLGFQTLASMYFSAIGRPKRATFISISRNGLFLIPALLILPAFLGLDGVLYSTSVSDACSVVLVSAVYIKGIRELDKKIQENSAPCQCAAKPEGGIL